MSDKNFTTSFLVDQSPQEVFDAINTISGWWTENVTGNSAKEGDQFVVRFGDVHYSKQKLTAVIPGEKITWLVTDSQLSFVNKQDEWTNTQIIFDISRQDNQTLIRFTHVGLVPSIECYGGCSGAWTDYINNSLRSFISTGKGQPAMKR